MHEWSIGESIVGSIIADSIIAGLAKRAVARATSVRLGARRTERKRGRGARCFAVGTLCAA
jgi:hypothetical protein